MFRTFWTPPMTSHARRRATPWLDVFELTSRRGWVSSLDGPRKWTGLEALGKQHSVDLWDATVHAPARRARHRQMKTDLHQGARA